MLRHDLSHTRSPTRYLRHGYRQAHTSAGQELGGCTHPVGLRASSVRSSPKGVLSVCRVSFVESSSPRTIFRNRSASTTGSFFFLKTGQHDVLLVSAANWYPHVFRSELMLSVVCIVRNGADLSHAKKRPREETQPTTENGMKADCVR